MVSNSSRISNSAKDDDFDAYSDNGPFGVDQLIVALNEVIPKVERRSDLSSLEPQCFRFRENMEEATDLWQQITRRLKDRNVGPIRNAPRP